jgi:putative oxidoreductase
MKKLLNLLKTTNHKSGIIYRLTLAAVLLPHGCQFLLGWFGGYGFSGSMNYLMQNAGLPWLIAFLVIFLQFFGSLLILVGLGSRVIAPAIIIMFIGMIITSHLDHGFFMNWGGDQQGEGFEYHLLVIGLSLALLINGSGKYSLDRMLTAKSNQTNFQ